MNETQPTSTQAPTDTAELLAHCNAFVKASADWRLANYEPKWHRWQRYSDSIYDPELAALKRQDQSKAFVPIVPTHREGILAALIRTMWGADPALEISPRIKDTPNDQSENVRDLLLRESDRTKLKVTANEVEDDATTYGSGFLRVRFEDKKEDRVVRQMQFPAQDDGFWSKVRGALGVPPPQPETVETIEQVTTYRGIVAEWISIWDVFPDPGALSLKGADVAVRYYTTQDEIELGVEQGYYLPDAAEKLRDIGSEEPDTQDIQQSRADRDQNSNTRIERSTNARKRRCFELEARLPRKFYFGPQVENPEALMPLVVRFHQNAVIMVKPSETYDGDSSLVKIDYFHVNGQFYGRGIPEMLKDPQEMSNETVSLRFDEMVANIRRKYAVIEAALVNPNDLNDPDIPIRLDAKKVKDVREGVMLVPATDVTREAYLEVQEQERYGQMRTSFNSQRIGTAVPSDNAKQTLGEVELLRQSAGEKFAYIGMMQEESGWSDVWRKMWATLYRNITPEDVLAGLGPQRAMTFELLTPEQIEQDYSYQPQGIYTMENKAQTQQALQALDAQYAGEPWYNRMGTFDRIAKSRNIDPATLKYTPAEMQQMMAAQHMMQQAQQPAPEPKPGAAAEKKEPAQQ